MTAAIDVKALPAHFLLDDGTRVLAAILVGTDGTPNPGGGGSVSVGPLGRLADAAALSAALSTEDVAMLGLTTETAPVTDTATAGLNGRLQRVAQRLSSLLALFPVSIGTKAAAASLSMVEASDSKLISTKAYTTPALITTNAGSVTSLLAAGTALYRIRIWNEHATETVRIRFGTNATSAIGYPLKAQTAIEYGLGEVPSGEVTGFSTNASTIGLEYA